MDLLVAGCVVAWANALTAHPGTMSPDDMSDAIGPGHRVVVDSAGTLVTWPLALRAWGPGRSVLLLPTEGDPRGLGRDSAARAITAGCAVAVLSTTGTHIAVPDWSTRVWSTLDESVRLPHIQVDLAARRLRADVLEAADILEDLSVAGGSRGAVDDVDLALSMLRLPPGFAGRAQGLIGMAARILAASTSALRHDGSSRSRSEIESRRQTLRQVQGSAREALEAAFNDRDGKLGVQ